MSASALLTASKKNKVIKILSFLCALAFVVVAGVYFSSVAGRRIHRFMSIETMAERIQTDLPKGSSVEQADKYLTDNEVEHSLAWDGKMYGIIRWIWGSWIVERDAQIVIRFQDGRVENIDVVPIATFL